MALCVLTAGWKLGGSDTRTESSGFIEGLVAIIVDHRLRAESTEEAILVHDRVNKMGNQLLHVCVLHVVFLVSMLVILEFLALGIKCQIENCDWSHGRPKHGHVQEAAREMRYFTSFFPFQN